MDTSNPIQKLSVVWSMTWLADARIVFSIFWGTENEILLQLILDCAMADRLVLDTLHLFDFFPCLSCYTKRVSSASLLLISSLFTAYVNMKLT